MFLFLPDIKNYKPDFCHLQGHKGSRNPDATRIKDDQREKLDKTRRINYGI